MKTGSSDLVFNDSLCMMYIKYMKIHVCKYICQAISFYISMEHDLLGSAYVQEALY